MCSDIKAKTRTVQWDSGKGDQELSIKEIKHRKKKKKMLLSKFFFSCLAAPFTKPQVRESM